MEVVPKASVINSQRMVRQAGRKEATALVLKLSTGLVRVYRDVTADVENGKFAKPEDVQKACNKGLEALMKEYHVTGFGTDVLPKSR